ncbi:MAG: YbhB/YbcL family Raf kinase inhibitor-like protein [Pseudolabrys sp.]
MTREAGTFAVTILFGSLAVVIALLPMTGVAFGQENNFVLSSPAFADNGPMAQKYAGKNPANPNCIGENISPPLEWHNAPAATRSYAIIMHDQEGRNGLGLLHWVVYGIDASTTSLPEGAGDDQRAGLIGGSNFLGKGSYYGGCPPKGTGPHHYVFTIIATDLDPTALKPGLTMPQMLDAIGSHALVAAGLVGRYGR